MGWGVGRWGRVGLLSLEPEHVTLVGERESLAVADGRISGRRVRQQHALQKCGNGREAARPAAARWRGLSLTGGNSPRRPGRPAARLPPVTLNIGAILGLGFISLSSIFWID